MAAVTTFTPAHGDSGLTSSLDSMSRQRPGVRVRAKTIETSTASRTQTSGRKQAGQPSRKATAHGEK